MTPNNLNRPRVTLVHLIAVAALVVAMAGSATAAALITGADIKDNTISTKDVKDETLKLKDIQPSERQKLQGKTGPQGPQGSQGLQGAQGVQGVPGATGASAFAPPPSGTLIVGGGILSGETAAVSVELRSFSELTFKPAAPLADDVTTRNIFFAPNASTIDTHESGVLCSGTSLAPTPTPGFLCVYPVSVSNVEANTAGLYAGINTAVDGADSSGFHVTPDSAAAGTVTFRYVWAYEAP